MGNCDEARRGRADKIFTTNGAGDTREAPGAPASWLAGRDPATNINGAAGLSDMDAIYGELSELGRRAR